MEDRIAVPRLVNLKGKKKLAIIDSFLYHFARIFDEACAEPILIFDSVCPTYQGLTSIHSLKPKNMIYCSYIVKRAAKTSLFVGDTIYAVWFRKISRFVYNVNNIGRFRIINHITVLLIEALNPIIPLQERFRLET
jgi:ketopantoate hydroxymethyltransferase